MTKTGRPTKLTEKLKDEICIDIAAGIPFVYAAQANGICYDSFNNYRQDGKRLLAEDRDDYTEYETLLIQFFGETTRAEGEAVKYYVEVVHDAGDPNVALKYLAKRWHRAFQEEQTHNVNNEQAEIAEKFRAQLVADVDNE